MPAVKVTLLFQVGTTDQAGNAARIAGFSESYYTTRLIDDPQLKTDWNNLAIARAALLPRNSRIVGSRYHNVDPVGGSRSYDNVYPGVFATLNDMPGCALQWTVRSFNTPNQRSLILRACPDENIVTGEYKGFSSYNAALINFFTQLTTNWKFRAIDRTVAPVKIISITAGGLLTTLTPHGLGVGDRVNIMATRAGDFGTISYQAIVGLAGTATTCTIFLPGRNEFIKASERGRARKALIIYPTFAITPPEVTNPTAIHRKAGGPFRKFRGRRTARKS